MVRKSYILLLCMALVVPLMAWAHVGKESVVEVRIIADHGSEFAKYRAYPRCRQQGNFFYVEAVKGDRYSIEVSNKSGSRIGVVIAVDGRNIISGQKSDLKRNERMYIIGPYETNTFEGWRTGMDRTNRFYFTEQSDSYAEKVFNDASAMGTIALAVYREKLPEIVPYSDKPSLMNESRAGAGPSAGCESRSAGKAKLQKDEEAGTGFGETTYSPARLVQFEPEHSSAERIVLKYEWTSELCRKGIIGCDPKNRFWPEDQEFAPIPEDFNG